MKDFGDCGLALDVVDSFAQPVAVSLAEFRDRIALRPMSKFVYLDDTEFTEGMDRIGHDIQRNVVVGPILEGYDLLVFAVP